MSEIEEINRLLNKCKITNMTNNKEKQELAFQSLNFINPFQGETDALAMFVAHVDSIAATISGLEIEVKQLFFTAIQRKLIGPAANLLRRENPTDWKALRSALLDEFGEKKQISTLILELGNIKFTNSVKLFCDTLNSEICKIKDCIKLSEETETRKTIYKLEVDRFSLEILRKNLPYHICALLNSQPVSDYKSALKILKENGSYFFEFKEKKFQRNTNVNNSFNPMKNYQPLPNLWQMPHFPYPSQYNTNIPQPFNYVQQNQNYQHYPNQGCPNQQHFNNNIPINFDNCPRHPLPSSSGQVNGIARSNNSNLSRIRRYGAPVPMEQDDSNFHLRPRVNYPM